MRVSVQLREPYKSSELVLAPGDNLVCGDVELAAQVGKLTSLETDLLVLAAAVYGADLAIRRGEREHFTRDIEIDIPVVNHRVLAPLVPEFEQVLWFLSEDNWTVKLSARSGEAEPTRSWPVRDGRTLLFSGGLDSLAAGVNLLMP